MPGSVSKGKNNNNNTVTMLVDSLKKEEEPTGQPLSAVYSVLSCKKEQGSAGLTQNKCCGNRCLAVGFRASDFSCLPVTG